jgi:N-glycosylase/DNA lyase
VVDWSQLCDEELAFDLAVCIASSQARFEVAEASVRALQGEGLLSWTARRVGESRLRKQIAAVLGAGVTLPGRQGSAVLRFPNRTAALLAATATRIGRGQLQMRAILGESKGGRSARCRLVAGVNGFGPKQASLFLRRVGFTSELAVLDRHVVDYLRICHGSVIALGQLGRLRVYEAVEGQFCGIAASQGIAVGRLDLAVWVAVRVAKDVGTI